MSLHLDNREIIVQDQRPLAAGAIEFEPGWDLHRFVEHLNGFAFFWPGMATGPIRYGCNHFSALRRHGDLVVLRIPTQSILASNGGRAPLFSRCNSGAARMNAGRKVPRGGRTFARALAFGGTPADVKEIVFEDVAILPQATEWASTLDGPWRSLV